MGIEAALIGAAVGGGIGAATGGGDRIWQGAAIGAGAGLGFGALSASGAFGAAGSTGTTAVAGTTGETAIASSLKGIIAKTGGTAAKSSAGSLFTNPFLLGAAGLGLASGLSSSGNSFQQKVELSSEGKHLQKNLTGVTKDRLDKAIAGDVRDESFQAVSNAKVSESSRSKAFTDTLAAFEAGIGNTGRKDRGSATVGAGSVGSLMVNAGESMSGMFNEYSILNNYSREELLRAVQQVQNLSNIDNQTAVFNYTGALADYNANAVTSATRGAAIGGVFSMMGKAALNKAYIDSLPQV